MKLKKMLRLITTVLLLVLVGSSIDSYAKEKFVSNQEITTYAEIIDWRYKIEDGKLYKRLYNYSLAQWVGEWILCP